MPDDGEISAPETPAELCETAAEYAKTVDIDVPLHRVNWEVSKRAKGHAGIIEVHLLEGELCNPITITLTWEALQATGWERMKETIRHELIHLYEYAQYGDSDHGDRFKAKADELDCHIHCDQFVEPRYTLECRNCGQSAGGRHVRSIIVKAPEIHQNGDCDCSARLRVRDIETGNSWDSWTEFKQTHDDADDLAPPYRYALSCASCETLVTTKDKRSRTVKYPHRYGTDSCDCDCGLRVVDVQTGHSWESFEELTNQDKESEHGEHAESAEKDSN